MYVRISTNKKKNDELMHYVVLGMKWGVRRALNKEAKASGKRASD